MIRVCVACSFVRSLVFSRSSPSPRWIIGLWRRSVPGAAVVDNLCSVCLSARVSRASKGVACEWVGVGVRLGAARRAACRNLGDWLIDCMC